MPIDKNQLMSILPQEKPAIINDNMFAKSAVLVPLIKSNAGLWKVLFQVRSSRLQRQPGEICFPGGILDGPQETPRQAARRETNEELGIRPEDIYIWGQLGLIISLFNMLVYSYVGQIP
ncbi:MAG TPA: CoA pyrophosphatase, partial [bacterium]|nr:CoA pyrophosphatase [bacterium]